MPRQKKCRSCGEWFPAYSTLDRACSPPCALKIVEQDKAKQKRKENKKRKQELKPLTTLCSEAQRDVNAYIRERDKERGCISCGGPVEDAGHFFHAGTKYRTSRVRFDERVIHGQCAYCNRYAGGGNIDAYAEGLRQRYGQSFLDELHQLKHQADRGELEPLTKDEVRQIASDHRKRVREMKRQREDT